MKNNDLSSLETDFAKNSVYSTFDNLLTELKKYNQNKIITIKPEGSLSQLMTNSSTTAYWLGIAGYSSAYGYVDFLIASTQQIYIGRVGEDGTLMQSYYINATSVL